VAVAVVVAVVVACIARSVLTLGGWGWYRWMRRVGGCRLVPLSRGHCHALDRGLVLTVDNIFTTTFFFYRLLNTGISWSILTLMWSNPYHSNRFELTNRLVPLPPCHCHSPSHCYPVNPAATFFNLCFCHFFIAFLNYHISANTATATF
jgi:hypothetical protein